MYIKIAIFASFLIALNCNGQDVDEKLLISIFGENNTGQNNSDNSSNKSAQNNFDNNSDTPATQSNKSCSTNTIPNGECVPYYLCSENNTIINNGMGVIDIRFNPESPCADYMDVCCNPPGVTTTPILPTPASRSVGNCGIKNDQGVGFRILGDSNNEAKFGEFPWMVAVFRQTPPNSSGKTLFVYACGGSLIHPQVVLTSAHCVIPPTGTSEIKMKIRAGEWDTQTKNEIYPHQDRIVSKIITHPQYYAGPLFNDVAILILETRVDIAENVGVVCLPPAGEEPPPSRCFVTGWGKENFGKPSKYQVILKSIELPIVERNQCQSDLRKTRLGKRFELHRTFICAGGEQGKDACTGDGGSPLVCPIPGKPGQYMQSGIVSWGIGCGEVNVPGVYANVGAFREWINEQMIYNKIDLTPYAV